MVASFYQCRNRLFHFIKVYFCTGNHADISRQYVLQSLQRSNLRIQFHNLFFQLIDQILIALPALIGVILLVLLWSGRLRSCQQVGKLVAFSVSKSALLGYLVLMIGSTLLLLIAFAVACIGVSFFGSVAIGLVALGMTVFGILSFGTALYTRIGFGTAVVFLCITVCIFGGTTIARRLTIFCLLSFWNGGIGLRRNGRLLL